MSDPYTAEEPGKALVCTGSEIAGSAAATAVGLIFGGPVGAVVGATLGPAATHVMKQFAGEVAQRVLGPRERVRAGAAVGFAAQRLEELLADGAQVRDDGFFSDMPSGRNAAREAIEGVVLVARNSFEERKIRHIGYLFANLAVEPALDPAIAALALHRAEALTWRQYVLLAAVGRADRLPLPQGSVGTAATGWTEWGAKREFMDLYEGGYFTAPEKKTERMGLTLFNTELSEQRLGTQGVLMHDLLALDEIADVEVREVHSLLEAEG